MWQSVVVWCGIIIALVGLVLVAFPIARLGVRTRSRAGVIAGIGALIAIGGMLLPTHEMRVRRPRTRLDAIMPVYQFSERHSIVVPAPPAHVLDAIRRVRAEEITFFRTLTWIRRGGRSLPPGILNPSKNQPLLDVALKGGFVKLADDSTRELVLGTVVAAPAGARGVARPETFRNRLPPGFALATMNFRVEPSGRSASLVSTETRVYANNDSARRRFAAYWRVIYPGSALIRRMWLRAIARRAESSLL